MENGTSEPTQARVFVRVRPFSAAEAKVCPEDSPVPRETILWDDNRRLTVLDAANNFHPRRNGHFDVEKVLWSFVDEERPSTVVHMQKDVYDAMVAPALPRIVDGLNTAFCFMGSTGSGRAYSLYGEDVDSIHCGVLPRFVQEIFTAFKREKRENSTVVCFVEAIDVLPNDTYVDLLAKKRKSQSSGSSDFKIVQDPIEGTRLQGVTRVEAAKAADVMPILRQLSRGVSKRNACHTVMLRLVETFEFTDPEQADQVVTKSRRASVLFALLRNMPSAFHRCIDVAIERDSGENPMAKVPTRDTAFTKLFPDLLQHGFYLNFLCCVSPFYEHAREAMQTLTMATKLVKIKCHPRPVQDEALTEMRNLAAEVKNLKSEMMKQSESTQIVQHELNMRELALMKQETSHQQSLQRLRVVLDQLAMAKLAIKINISRTRMHRAMHKKLVTATNRTLEQAQTQKKEAELALKAREKEVVEINKRIKLLEGQLEKEKAETAAHEAAIEERQKRVEEMKEMRLFIAASNEERITILKKKALAETQASSASEQNEKEVEEVEEALKKASQRCAIIEPAFTLVQEEENKNNVKELEAEVQKLEKAISAIEAEIRLLRLQAEKKKAGCACTLM
ncbi:Microtubule binding Kinesin motor domain [Trypanosoma vivax]|uniref:Putative kinesin-like protein n=1 Tax=Trypanosoma vivax (strain Y486) TaxID=1055687 RepID=G0UCX3_TRYVY|nr:putative kinesin-like protein [Trypanosoma vivax]KAH8607854.1 Microtubule binding Kinesin motor domain [Trypanosoma vivax]CCC53683.1 putative kinesin-like protein [Trypanosoma vivax Y486]